MFYLFYLCYFYFVTCTVVLLVELLLPLRLHKFTCSFWVIGRCCLLLFNHSLQNFTLLLLGYCLHNFTFLCFHFRAIGSNIAAGLHLSTKPQLCMDKFRVRGLGFIDSRLQESDLFFVDECSMNFIGNMMCCSNKLTDVCIFRVWLLGIQSI